VSRGHFFDDIAVRRGYFFGVDFVVGWFSRVFRVFGILRSRFIRDFIIFAGPVSVNRLHDPYQHLKRYEYFENGVLTVGVDPVGYYEVQADVE